MSEQATQKIRKTAAQLEPAILGGLFKGITMLTPPDVQGTKGLRFWEMQAEFKADLGKGARSLHSQPWMISQGKVYNLHVYEGGPKFPDACPVNLETPSHYEVVQVSMVRRSVRFQMKVPREKLNRIATALSSDRYWFAIPFSRYHGPDDRAVHIEAVNPGETGSRAKVLFRNREYAQRFGELNSLEGGKWLAARHLVMRVVGYLGIIPSVGVAGGTGWAIYNGLSGNWGSTSPGQMVPWFVIGLVGLGASIYLFWKGSRGEPI